MVRQSTSPPPYSAERVAYARRVWEPIYGRALSDAEVQRIIFNTSGLLRALFGLREPRIGSAPVHPNDPTSTE